MTPQDINRCFAWHLELLEAHTYQMDAVTTAVIANQVIGRLVSSGKWEHVKELMQRGDRPSAAAEVDRALARTDDVILLDERTKDDARFKVLALASVEDRPLVSTVLGMQSAEKVGENLTKATWALVAASAALVVATVVLVIITALKS